MAASRSLRRLVQRTGLFQVAGGVPAGTKARTLEGQEGEGSASADTMAAPPRSEIVCGLQRLRSVLSLRLGQRLGVVGL